jgi:glycosyltransferase involved in cell wall biosynthesis
MLLDVVICVKNQAIQLNRILHQISREIPYNNLIVIYGSSNDNTKNVAEKYTNKVFWDEDKGLGYARKLGILQSTSKIVAMIDSDVILTPGWYENLIKYFQDPAVAAVMGTCIYGYGYKPLQNYWEYLRKNEKINYGCQNTMFRRSIILKIGNFDPSIKGAGEDYDLYLRLISNGYKWEWARDATVNHPMSMWEYLKHVRWSAKGTPNLKELAKNNKNISLPRFWARQIFDVIDSFWRGLKLTYLVHPTFLIYWPIIKISLCLTALNLKAKNLV